MEAKFRVVLTTDLMTCFHWGESRSDCEQVVRDLMRTRLPSADWIKSVEIEPAVRVVS